MWICTQTWKSWYWCANVCILESWRSGKPLLFSSAIDENNLAGPPRPGDLLHTCIVQHCGYEVLCVAIFGPKGAGNCVNQRGQIMPPHWLTPPVQRDSVEYRGIHCTVYSLHTPQRDTVYINLVRCQQCTGERVSESPPSLLICNYWQLVELEIR